MLRSRHSFDLSINGETAFEREIALHVLEALDGSATDKPLSNNILELLELMGATVEDWNAASER
jgi:hypothetical protein